MKSLKVIQILAKIGKIASRVIYILCCVGFWGGIAAIISYALIGDGAIKIGGTSVMGLIQSNADISSATLCGHIACGIVTSAAEAMIARRSLKYFEHELEDGTPFTCDGAGELLKLGIYVIVLPICAVIICAIGIAIAGHFNPELTKPSWLENTTSAGVGITMIITSLLCRYGAELSEPDKETVSQNGVENPKKEDEKA